MIKKLSEIWTTWCETGLKWPNAFDPETQKPSVTLLMFYFSTLVMFTSVITLHFFPSIIIGSMTSVGVWIVGFVMYRLRKLDKFKIDLDDQEIELDGSNGEQKEKDNE